MNRYIVPELGVEAQVDRCCPGCGRRGSGIHGYRFQEPEDTRIDRVRKTRMRCGACRKTWTLQPSGLVKNARRSQRVKVLNVLLYAFGLSYRRVAVFMNALGVVEERMTVARDVQSAGARALCQLGHLRRRVRLAGIDGTGQRLASPGSAHSEGVIFVVDFGDGQLLDVRLMSEDDSKAVGDLVKELETRFGIERWVSDEEGSYTQIPPSRHDLCTAHFLKNKRRRLRELARDANDVPEPKREQFETSLRILDRVLAGPIKRGAEYAGRVHQVWIHAPPPKKGEKQTPEYKLQQLALAIWNNWDRIWNHTNNATERAIGRTLKVRSKTMRGFKVPQNILRFAALSEHLVHPSQEPVDLEPLV